MKSLLTTLMILVTGVAIAQPTISLTNTNVDVCAGTTTADFAYSGTTGAPVDYSINWDGTANGAGFVDVVNAALPASPITATVPGAAPAATYNGVLTVRDGGLVTSVNYHITVTIQANVTPSVSISSTDTTICFGDTVTFTATPVNGGTSPTYQWKVNGSNVGTNSSTYVNSSLAHLKQVSCEITSNATCASPAIVTSNTITMDVAGNFTPTISIAADDTSICSGTFVTFTSAYTFEGPAPTYQWRVNGTNAGTNYRSFITSSLADNDVVTCVLTSSIRCPIPSDTVVSNSITMGVTPTVTPSVSISITDSVICDSTSVTFTAIPTNGGTSPSYQWKVNGSNVGTNSSTYTTTTLNNGDVVTCEMTSNETCLATPTGVSNTITMTVNPNLVPMVVISSTDTVICDSTSVTFTAVGTNGGTSPTYQWKLNGGNVGTNSTTYTSSTLSNGDVVTCELTSNETCLATPTGVSNGITMTVNPNLVPTVAISSTDTTICDGTSVTFTATPTNGGASPTYQWKLNGGNVGTNSATYVTTTLSNGDVVGCEMTSNATCLATPTGVSNNITMTVNPLLTPSISITSNKPDTICANDTVTYTATPTNGGTTPSYQWRLNGGNVGTNSATYTQTSFTNGDVISCVLTSSETCASPTTGTSNDITMTVQGTTPGVSIVSSLGSTICAGSSVTFTATASNAGASPIYQWEVNGNPVGINSATYVTAALNDGDTVNCIVTSSLSCSSPTTALSNKIGMTVNPNLTPIIAISISPNDTICDGTSVTFTSTYANGGPTPSFQWKVNGTNAGINADSFVTSSLANGDVVTVVMTSSETCVTKSADTSNGITMTVNPNLVPVATIVVTPNDTICDGANAIFTSSIANGGLTPTYQWQVNGTNTGTNDTFQTTGLSDGDQVRLIMKSSETCLAKLEDTSNVITMTIVPNVTPSVSIGVSPNDTICDGTSVTFTATPTNGGTTPSYQWKLNGTDVGTNSATFTTSTLNDGDVVAVAMTSSLPCVTSSTALSNAITMKVNPIITPDVTISVSPNDTICAGVLTTFTATPTNGGTTPSYQWKLNGNNVGTNSATYINAGLADGDVVTVVMTSNGVCLTKPDDTSNAITMEVIPNLTPVVIITMSPVDTVCEGTNVTFSATSANGGTSPTYQWQVNGSNVGTNSPTYSSTMLNNGDVVRLSMTSNLMCLTKPADTSNTLTAMVNAKKVPDVTIAVSPNDTLCAGNLATFTATPTNGGTTPSYQWLVNGTPVGTNSTTYASTGLSNNDVVTVVMTSSDTCVTQPADTSSGITMTINPITTPVVTIAVSANDTICDGDTTTFTATATDAGMTPSYQWQLNGTNVGTNNATYVTTTLNNADVVRCIVTTSDTCITKDKDTSNAIQMTVNPNLTPVVTIAVAPNDTICDGTSVTFSTTVTNGGTTPGFQWRLNGNNVGGNTSTYVTDTLKNGDVVDCILTSSETCVTKVMDTSNNITMTVNPNLTPDVTITVTPNDTICTGTSTTFVATATNGGTTPTYQWQINGTNVGTNNDSFTTTTLTDGDVVRCILTSSEVCVTKSMDTSNSISMHVKPYLTPLVVTVVSPNDTICDGTSVTFTATGANGGTPTYQWMVNSTNVGTNDTTYTTNTLTNGDTVRVIMTSSEMCLTKAADTSDDIIMTVNPNLTPSVSITASPGDTICDGQITSYNATPTNGGATPTYQWRLNGANVGINSSGYATAGLSTGDEIEVIMTSSEVCVTKAADTSNKITMFVHPLTKPSISILSNVGTTICDGGEVEFTSNWSGGGTTQAFQWRRNGVNIAGATADTFTTSTITNGDVITLRMDITAACPDPDSAVSNVLGMAVVTPSVSVTVSPNDTICQNQSAMFTLTGTNVGNLPVYQWRVNGVDMVGAQAATYVMPTVNNQDSVTAVFISSDNCVNAPEVPSLDTIVMTVNDISAPVAGITANPSNVFGPNDIVWFSSSVNAPNASYQWRKNGADIPGATGLVYTELNPQDGDTISLWIKANDTCRMPDTAVSNIIVLQSASGVAQLPTALFNNVTVAPNPNNGTFMLQGELATRLREEVVKVEVINTVGQVIHREEVQLSNHELKLRIELGDKAHNGLHLIRLSAEGNKQMFKFITNR